MLCKQKNLIRSFIHSFSCAQALFIFKFRELRLEKKLSIYLWSSSGRLVALCLYDSIEKGCIYKPGVRLLTSNNNCFLVHLIQIYHIYLFIYLCVWVCLHTYLECLAYTQIKSYNICQTFDLLLWTTSLHLCVVLFYCLSVCL